MSSYGSDKHFTVTSDRDGSRSFGEHDNRWNPKYTRNKHGKGKQHYGRGRRRGGYGGGRDRRGGSGSGSGLDPRSRFEDDGDVAMEGAAGSSSRYTPYGQSSRHGTSRGRSYRSRHGGRDSRQRRSNRDISTLQKLGLPIASDHRWYKVTVPYGKKGGKDFVLKMINNLIDVPLQPIYYHHEGQSALFYVKDADAANAIKKVNKKVTMPNGFKMVVIVAPSQPPFIPMDEDTIKKLQLCMSRRYDPASRALNLSVMYEDEELKSEGLFFALNRANVMSNVIKTIQENIPELVRLDISKNRLLSLSHLTDLVSVTPDIRFLNIGKNQLRGIEELDKIQGWKLEELILDGNDLCDRFKDRNEYISAVRKRFPKVVKLDGHTLPPPIVFELETSTVVPPSKGSYFLNEEVKNIVVKFLREYYSIYDSDNRQSLIEAYHDQAVFSLSASYNDAIEYRQPSMADYSSESRNLFKIKDRVRREKLLKHGRLPIVSFMCLLPKTTHDPNSFIVDISHATPTMLIFSLCGVFKETDSKADKPPIRHFNRMFITVPSGPGMVITNDMLTISNASPEQLQAAFKSIGPTPSSSPVSEAPPALTTALPVSGLTTEHQQMMQAFSAQSGMNLEWSGKCLEENGWNYEKAGQVFTDLQNQGKIPPEAFVK